MMLAKPTIITPRWHYSPHAPHGVWSLPPEGALRLRAGKARPTALLKNTSARKSAGASQTSRGRGTGSAGPQAQRPPRGAGSYTK